MKKLMMLALASATLGLTACHDTKTPDAVVATAGYAIHTNNLSSYRATLTEEMRNSYFGTQQAVDELRSRANGDQLRVGTVAYYSKASCGGNCTDSQYKVDVLRSNGSVAANVWVTCRTSYTDGHKGMKWRNNRCLINGVQL